MSSEDLKILCMKTPSKEEDKSSNEIIHVTPGNRTHKERESTAQRPKSCCETTNNRDQGNFENMHIQDSKLRKS